MTCNIIFITKRKKTNSILKPYIINLFRKVYIHHTYYAEFLIVLFDSYRSEDKSVALASTSNNFYKIF